jgi:outer membrane protein
MKNKTNYLLHGSIFFIGLLLLSCNSAETNKQVVFMDNFKVFEEFKLKKEYDSLLFKDQEKFKKQLDSLSAQIELNKDPGVSDALKKEYVLYQQKLSEELQSKSGEYTEIVYDRLNNYVKAYGKEKNYTLILGGDGKGGVMYVDSTVDITTELIQYINKKYNDE